MNGIAGHTPETITDNLQPLFQEILKLPRAKVDSDKPLQLLIANVDYDDFKVCSSPFFLFYLIIHSCMLNLLYLL